MNFADFSFWWILFVSFGFIFVIRFFCKSFNLWSANSDRISLLLISLFIFWNAAHYSFIIFVIELFFNYLMVCWLLRSEGLKSKLILGLTITVDLLILAYFKYFNFLILDVFRIQIFSQPEISTSLISPNLQQIPPGISFYTFQIIAFVVDSFRAKDRRNLNLLDYLNFVAFFPQIVAGPIERQSDLLPQVQRFQLKLNLENLEIGLRWVVFGLFFKLVLSDNIAPLIDLEVVRNAWAIWLSIYLFGLRIYFDFAGYSFIALGLAKILGIQLTMNFHAPYIATNVQEFWRRWHITLSTWFRDYLYFPLGGSRVPWVALNLMIVFTLSGLWHGASWNFIVWGAYHGILLLVYRYLGKRLAVPAFLAWVMTFGSVMLGWLFFMETDLQQLGLKLQTLISPAAYSLKNLAAALPDSRFAFLILLFLSTAVLLSEHISRWQKQELAYTALVSPWVTRLMLVLIIWLSAESSDFIYFAF
jgi:alginate O-acetyltransferase complex protein AlgI